MNRGLSVFHTYQLLMKHRSAEITAEQQFKAHVLGWCVEWLQAFFLVADDIMDHSVTRRGQPCWYLKPKVGNMAINDSFILESCIYRVIKKYFKSDPFYGDLLELFHEVTYQTELGQLMDLLTAPEGDIDLNRFTLERYYLIVEYKTAYYSFYLPVALAMLMAGVKDESMFKQANDILIPLGKFFQIQDDYLDCYGDPATIGKIGTDIEDNKCSWLVVQALSRASEDQRKLLESFYGRKEPENVAAVKKLYRDLDLESVYRQYEEQSFKEISNMIEQVDESVMPKAVFMDFAKRIYKRQK